MCFCRRSRSRSTNARWIGLLVLLWQILLPVQGQALDLWAVPDCCRGAQLSVNVDLYMGQAKMQNLLQRFADGGAQLHPVPGRTTAYRSLHCRAILSTPPLHAPAGERLTVLETPTEFFHALLVSAAQQMLMEMEVSSNASRVSRASVPVLKDRLMGLQDGIAKAHQRITIGSLYIGTDAGREAELVSALAAACTAADRQELQVTSCVVRRGCSCRLCCCATGNI